MKRKAAESNFQHIPAGEQVIRIKEVDESEYAKFDKLTVTIEDAGGRTARVNLNFANEDGTLNETADFIYTRIGRAAMGDETLDEIDSQELVGKFVEVEIVHKTGNQGGTFANVKRWIGPGKAFTPKAASAGSKPATGGSTAAEKPKKSAAEILAEMKAKKAAGK
jgi:hypothetical protein